MSFRTLSIIVCLLMSMMAARQLTADWMNPLQMPDPRNTITGQQVVLRFRFPTASAGNTGPTGSASPGLAYKQFLGVVFPASVGTTDLILDQGASPKWSCALTDGTYTYSMTAVQSVASPIVTSLTAESNIAYCRLDDTSANVPLKVNAATTYTLTITFSGTTKIASNYLRSIGLFTSTANHQEKMIIDAAPVFGTMAIYGDNQTSKILDITANAIAVNSDPSLTAKSTTIYPYNSFDVTLSMKSTGFITAADNIIVLKYDTTVVSLTSPTVTSADNAANDALQVALKGNLSLKAFGTGAFYIDGITEDLIPNRQFKLTIKGWKALDLPTSAQSAVQLIVYYKNTYSVISYLSYAFLTITKDVTTLTANHPESWDVYRGGAYPIAFTFKTTTDLANGGWVVIQHSNYAASSTTDGKQVTFITSTCDFSDNDASLMEQGFGKRNNCYPLRPLDNTATGTNGSGFFFYVKGPIAFKNTYKVTIWTFFDLCGGSNDASMNILGSTYTVQPTFTVSIYKTMDPAKLNESRFAAANVISSSSATTFGQNCWNNFVYASDAKASDVWTDAITAKVTATQASGASTLVAFLNYREFSDWVIFSETQDNHANISGTPWYQTPKSNDINTAVTGIKFLYSTSNAITSGSFFLVGLAVSPATGASVNTNKIPLPIVKGTNYDALAPGRFWWQFPSKWFTAGNGYKAASTGTCYCSWYMNKKTGDDFSGNARDAVLGPFVTVSGASKLDYKTKATKNAFFGANGVTTADAVVANQIEESKTYAGGDSTKTGKDAIYRVVSVFNDAAGTGVWWFADAAKIIAMSSSDQTNIGLFTSCFKWATTLPTITSLYTAIDIHIKWNYTGKDNAPENTTTGDGRTIMMWRLIKLFPETGVTNDWAKNYSTSLATVSPLISHTVYSSSTNDAVCLLELNASVIGPMRDSSSNTLVLWIFGGTILETDYNDVSATYPVAPLNSGISAYGNQNGQTIDLANPYAAVGTIKTPILELISGVNNNAQTGPVAASLFWAQANSNYLFFMGSTIYLTSVSSTFLTSTADNNSNMFIPYYCPRFLTGYMAAGATVGTKTALPFPLVMAAYTTMGGYNSITSVNTWVTYSESTGANKAVKVLMNKYVAAVGQTYSKTVDVVAGLATANVYQATLKWTPYTTTDTTQNNLYVYNGTTAAAGTAVICTGHSLFISSSISIDTTNPAFTWIHPCLWSHWILRWNQDLLRHGKSLPEVSLLRTRKY
jgi:hypothetical protein